MAVDQQCQVHSVQDVAKTNLPIKNGNLHLRRDRKAVHVNRETSTGNLNQFVEGQCLPVEEEQFVFVSVF